MYKLYEIKVLSLNKVARQSSIAHAGEAARAVDGNANQDWYGYSCSCTQNEQSAWWYVDLVKFSKVINVTLYNRLDCCWQYLGNFDIAVLASVANNTFLVNNQTRCAYQDVVIRVHTFQCPNDGLIGRYVLVKLRGTGHLQLCELTVVGYNLQ
jgi:hypothetical protein